MFVGEIMMSFKGISEKLLPGAVAGVDCAATFCIRTKICCSWIDIWYIGTGHWAIRINYL